MKKIAFAALFAVSAFSANAAVGELVVNGDFETGTFAGWTKSGNTSLSDVIANTVTSNHSFVWRSGATGTPAIISQNLATTAGSSYTLSFDLFSSGTSTDPSKVAFAAFFGGSQVYGFQNTTLGWTHFTFENLTATSALTELKFSSRNDPGFTRLDNVSVTAAAAVPEPETYALMLAGLGLIAGLARRRSKQQ